MYDELVEGNVPENWAGVDIGKTHHHCVVINAEGKRLLSRRVQNDESELLALIGDVWTSPAMCCGPSTLVTVAPPCWSATTNPSPT